MSDLPLFTDPKDADEFAKAFGRQATVAGSTILPAWLTQLSPYRVDDQGQGHIQMPGGLQAAYGAAGELVPMLYNWGAGKIGLEGRLPPAPGAEKALQNYAETKQTMLNAIPHVEPQTPDEQMSQDLAFGGAGMAVPGAGALAAGLRLIPFAGRAASAASHFAIPGPSAGNVLTGVGFTAGAEGLNASAQDELIRNMGVDPADVQKHMQSGTPTPQGTVPASGTDQWDLSAPDQTHVVTNPSSGATEQVPFPTTSPSQTNQPLITISLSAKTVPEYGSTGESQIGWGQFAAWSAAAAGLTWGFLKIGGKVLDPAYKLLTGELDQRPTPANIANFNANLDAIDNGIKISSDGGAGRGEAPLPGKAGTVGTNLAQAGWDRTRVLSELVTATTDNTPAAKLATQNLLAELGNTNGGSSLATRIGEQMATGVNDATKSVLPKPSEMAERYAVLSPAQQKAWEEGMQSASENDYRNIKRARYGTKPFVDEDLRTNFVDAHTNVLQTKQAAMMADPQQAALADLAHSIVQQNWDEAVTQGRLTASDAANFKLTNPNYIPTMDINGRPSGGLFNVDQPGGTGWQIPNTNVLNSIISHYGKFYDTLGHNTLTDQILRHLETWQAADPARQRIISPIENYKKPVGQGKAPGRVITVYREGVPYSYHINNTHVFDALKNNRAQANVWFNGLDAFRRSMQSGTTGVSATLLGQRPFAAIGLLRNVPQIAIDKSRGVKFGVADQWLQDVTGGRISNRMGIDPTQYIGSINAGVRGAAAVTAKNTAVLLRNPANPVTKMWVAMKGQPWVDNYAAWLDRKYAASDAAIRRREGAQGGGTGGLTDLPTFNRSVSNTAGFNPLADAVPQAFDTDRIHIPLTHVPIPGTKGAVSTWINFRTLLREANQEIYDGANSYLWKQNPQLSPAVRAFESRRTIGDPSMQGDSAVARFLGTTVPYFNPSLQDTVRALRNFRDNPGGYVMGMMGTLVMLNSISLLTAMLGGDEHMNVLEREITSHERASNVFFFHDTQNGHNYTELNLSQRYRAANAMVQELLALGSGAFGLRKGEPLFDRLLHSIADVWSHHMSFATQSGMAQGASDFLDFVQPPQIVQTLAGMAGKNINPVLGSVATNYIEGRPLNTGVVTDVGAASRIPGRQQNSYISKDDNGWWQRLMSNTMGIAGHAMYDHLSKAWQQLSEDPNIHGVANAMSGLVGNAGQSWRDNAPFGNMVWGNNVKMNYRNPMEENLQGAMEHMRTMPKAEDIYAAGFTRPGGLPATQKTPNVNPDPTIQQMLVTVNNYYANLNASVQPQINDLKKQLDDIDNNPHYDARMIRELHNAQVAKINAVVEQGDLLVRQMNMELSQMAGKTVHVKAFDASKGLDQFHD